MRTETDDLLWSAVADPSRRLVLDLLVHGGDASASALAAQVPFSRQAVAKHLVVLEGAGLLARRRRGREVLYAVAPEGLARAAGAMADQARRWDRRLARRQEAAESGARDTCFDSPGTARGEPRHRP